MTPSKSSSKLLAITAGQLISAILLIATPAIAQPAATAQQRGRSGSSDKVNPNAAAMKGFIDRVNAYVALQKKVDNGLPKLRGDETSSEIEAHQAAMAARIKLARRNAKPGDIFGDAAPIVRGIIRKDASLRTGRDSRAAMEEVPKYDPPAVNAAYPEKGALATMPPLLLDQLQRLPEGLEYRFMGNDLILRDVQANLIADFVNEALAPISKK